MAKFWLYIESDFQREYNINLAQEVDNMTSRRFFTLLFGLSSTSMYWLVMQNHKEEINDPETAERTLIKAFQSVGK